MKKIFVILLCILSLSSYGQIVDSTFNQDRFADLREWYIDVEKGWQEAFAFQDSIREFHEQNGVKLLGYEVKSHFRSARQIRRAIRKSFRKRSLFPLMQAPIKIEGDMYKGVNNKYNLWTKRELQSGEAGKNFYDFPLMEEFLSETVSTNCLRVDVKWEYKGKTFKTIAFCDDDIGLFYENIIAGRLFVGQVTEYRGGKCKVSFPMQEYKIRLR